MSEYDSGELSPSESYTLQRYTFTLQSMYDDENDITGVTVKMTHDGQTEVQGIDIDGRVAIDSWEVEASNTEASVHVRFNDSLVTGDISSTVIEATASEFEAGVPIGSNSEGKTLCLNLRASMHCTYETNSGRIICATSAECSGSCWVQIIPYGPGGRSTSIKQYSHKGKTVYYYESFTNSNETIDLPHSTVTPYDSWREIAWAVIYGIQKENVGVFQIDLGEDPGPEPPDPGDDWEEPESTGDPDYTLKLKIIGALSGRHNDPLHDTSLSFSPADQISVKGYGGGGDGGHGGGGGAGASTIIVRRFVTDKAGSIEVTAISKRHGYGSGGGKGGRGGDGCILVFY